MKIINRTKCPDEILKNLVLKSAETFRECTGLPLHLDRRCPWHEGYEHPGVVIQFTQAKHKPYVSGTCWETELAKANGKFHATDGGWMRIKLPAPRHFSLPLPKARVLWETLLHEWTHISDYQRRASGDWVTYSHDEKRIGGRRPNWENRPEEIRAEKNREKVIEKNKDDGGDELLEWALWYDRRIQENKKRLFGE